MKKSYLILIILALKTGITDGQLLFSEKSDEYGLNHTYDVSEFLYGGVTFFDFNRDGLDDLSFTTGKGDSLKFYLSTGSGFTNIGGLGISEKDNSKQILWIDFDNDGDSDLFVTNYEGQSNLWENIGDLSFVNITKEAGINLRYLPTYGSSWGDFDRDGYLDFYLTNYSSPAGNSFERRTYLYRNKGNGTFEEVSIENRAFLNGNYYFSSAFLDLNRSGWPDLFVIQDFGNSNEASGNVLFWNNRGEFMNASNSGSIEDVRMSAMSIAAGDFNKSGHLDVYITNTPYTRSKFHINMGDSTFSENAELSQIQFNDDGYGWGAQFFDIDNDTWEDLCVVGATPTHQRDVPPQVDKLYRNLGNSTFGLLNTEHIDFSDSTKSRSIAYGDFNSDGLLDFSIATINPDSVLFYENVNTSNNHFITFKLNGTASNKDGIGTWIEVYTKGEKQVRYTTCGLGFLSQNTSKVHIGLGSTTTIDSIFVKWPSGWNDKYYDIPSDQFISVLEGETADFRFELNSSRTLLDEQISEITISAPEFDSYSWNTDSQEKTLTVKKSGIYICSVINVQGEYGLSFPIKIEAALPQNVNNILTINQSNVKHLVHPTFSTTGNFKIDTSSPIKTYVFNINGKQIWQGNSSYIDLSSEPSGVYIVKINMNEKLITQKILKL